MSGRGDCEVVRVDRCDLADELVEIARERNLIDAALAKRILQSAALGKMVDAVACGEVEGVRVEIVIRG